MSVFAGGPFLNGGEGGPWSEVTLAEASARWVDGYAGGIQNAPPIIVMLENSGKPMYTPAFVPVSYGFVVGDFNDGLAGPFFLFGEEYSERVSLFSFGGVVHMEYGDYEALWSDDAPVDISFGVNYHETLRDGWTARYFIFNG